MKVDPSPSRSKSTLASSASSSRPDDAHFVRMTPTTKMDYEMAIASGGYDNQAYEQVNRSDSSSAYKRVAKFLSRQMADLAVSFKKDKVLADWKKDKKKVWMMINE